MQSPSLGQDLGLCLSHAMPEEHVAALVCPLGGRPESRRGTQQPPDLFNVGRTLF